MKQVFILIEKWEINNVTDFYERREMTQSQADLLNEDLNESVHTKNLKWVLQPNY